MQAGDEHQSVKPCATQPPPPSSDLPASRQMTDRGSTSLDMHGLVADTHRQHQDETVVDGLASCCDAPPAVDAWSTRKRACRHRLFMHPTRRPTVNPAPTLVWEEGFARGRWSVMQEKNARLTSNSSCCISSVLGFLFNFFKHSPQEKYNHLA